MVDKKRIGPSLRADRRRRTVPRVDAGVVSEGKEDVANRRDQRRMMAARQVGSSDRSGEERVADEEIFSRVRSGSDLQADTTGTVARRVMGTGRAVAEANHLAGGIKDVDWRLRLHLQAEHPA
jgi:hypothetical protein